MNSEKINRIIEDISHLSITEACELAKALRAHFDLPDIVSSPVGAAPAAKEEEAQSEFDVILQEVGAKKIEVIKVLRKVANLGLKEAKDFVDAVAANSPYTIATEVDKKEADELVAAFADTGATIVLK